jgi:hypothetical protein
MFTTLRIWNLYSGRPLYSPIRCSVVLTDIATKRWGIFLDESEFFDQSCPGTEKEHVCISAGPRMFAAAVFCTSPLRSSHWASSLATLRLKCFSTQILLVFVKFVKALRFHFRLPPPPTTYLRRCYADGVCLSFSFGGRIHCAYIVPAAPLCLGMWAVFGSKASQRGPGCLGTARMSFMHE